MSRFLTIPAGRRAKWVVLAIWLIVIFAASAANLPAKFDKIQKNDSASFLPSKADLNILPPAKK